MATSHRNHSNCQGDDAGPSRFGAGVRGVLSVAASAAVVGGMVVVAPGAAAVSQTVVSLAFDNNTVSEYTLGFQQALQPAGVTGTFFVNSGTIGASKNFMSWTQVAALTAAGNEIGGKTVDGLVNLKTNGDMQTKINEVCNDRQALIAHGLNPISFAYPFGAFDATAESIVKNCGYGVARTGSGLSVTGPTYAETLPPRDYFATRAYAPGGQLTLANVEALVSGAAAHGGGWDQIVLGKVCSQAQDPNNYATCTASSGWMELSDLQAFITWLQNAGQSGGAPAGTVIKTVGAASISSDTVAPVTTIACNGAACSSGAYGSTVLVSLAATDTGSAVAATRFTTDGTDPTQSSPLYTRPFPVTQTQTIKYRSWDNAGNAEVTNTTVVQVQQPPDNTPPTTTILCNGTPCSNTPYVGGVTITLSAADNSGGWGLDKTYYTTDGSTPNTGSPVYTGPLSVKGGTTIKFFSTDLAGNAEQVQSQTITFSIVVSLTFDDGDATAYTMAYKHALLPHGMHATFYDVSGFNGNGGSVTWDQLTEMYNHGNEIGGHTEHHIDLTSSQYTTQQKTAEVCDDRHNLIEHGLDPVSFAYPFGAFNSSVEQIVQGCGYATARATGGLDTAGPGAGPVYAEPLPPKDPYATRTEYNYLNGAPLTLEYFQSAVNAAAQNGGGWVTLVLHQVCSQTYDPNFYNDCMGSWAGTDLSTFNALLDWLQNAGQAGGAPAGTTVKTVRQVMTGPDTTPPATTISCDGSACQAGTYSGSTTVALNATDKGGAGVNATYYTTDGSTPTTSSPVYTGPFTITQPTDVKYMSVDTAGNVESVVATHIDVTPNADPVVGAAGDIACDPASGAFNNGEGVGADCRAKSTGLLLTGLDAVLPLGDVQYDCGGLLAYQESYDKAWGSKLAITHPVPGDKDYATNGGTDCPNTPGAGYYEYFGSRAGDPSAGYYSYDLGQWHVIALNTATCGVDPAFCAAGSAQEQWLQQDLAAHSDTTCTLAYYQNPRFTSTPGGGDATYQPIWRDLYAGGVDVVLNGDSHWYERFAPMDDSGVADPNGMREFIAGTGGAPLDTPSTQLPTSQVVDNSTHGILKLTLHQGNYDWNFVNNGESSFTDSGTSGCNGIPAPKVTLAQPADGSTVGAKPMYSGDAGTAPGDLPTVTVNVYSGNKATGSPVQTLSAQASGGIWSTMGSVALVDGTYTAVATQSDKAGNTGTSAPVTFTVNTNGPSVTITAPASGATLDTATPTVWGTGSPANDASHVQLSVYAGSTPSGSPVQTADSAVAADGTWSTNLSALADGTYTLQATQADGNGNVGTSQPVTFNIDTTAPNVTLTAPADGAIVNTATPNLSGAGGAAPGDSGHVTVQLYTGSGVSGSPLQSLTAPVVNGAWSVTPASLPDGTYTAQASQTDAVGNTGTSAQATFRVDTSAPKVVITQPADGANVSALVLTAAGTAGSDKGDAANVTLRVYAGGTPTGTPVQTLPAQVTSGAWTSDVQNLPDGTYTLQATQNDNAGNTGTSAAVTVTLKSSFTANGVTPSSVGQGALAKTLTIAGSGFVNGINVSFSGTGINVTSVTVNNGSSVSVTVDVAGNAPTGQRNVTIGQPGQRSATCTGCLTVNPAPMVNNLAPSSLGQGAQQVQVKVNGSGFVNGALVTFSGSGVTGSVTATSASVITLSVNVANGAATGTRDVTVVQPDGGRTVCAACFTVNAGPRIDSVSPSTIKHGTSSTVTILGANFVKNANVSVSGSQVNVGKVTWVSATKMTAVLNANKNAPLGVRSVSVTNPDSGVGTLANCLTVT